MMTDKMIAAALVFAAFFALSMVIHCMLKKVERRFHGNTAESFRLISNSQKAILIFIGTVLALSKLDFDVTGLVAGLGLTGFALGFALKDAISNLVAGIMIVLYRPIRLSDVIEVAGCKGKVVDLNLRYMTLCADGCRHLVPNSLILSNKVTISDD
ncbi:mechanosensitive ion channel family protein [Pseudoalteromonas mariniglutinosa]|uniref:mechanosensitive ion channel family protein n=1 Tax=Pseudoalteromonas mariniglutinosa TaxID=206042 RepID=UPI003850A469